MVKKLIIFFYILLSLTFTYPNTINTENNYIIQNVNIIPMNKETILYNYDLTIENGIIKTIEKHNIKTSSKHIIIDGTNKYLIPGLTDMKVHFYNDEILTLFLANGITTVRNASGKPYHLKLRKKINEGEIIGPNIFTSSPVLDGPYPYYDNIIKVLTPKQAIKYVTKFKKQGYDYIMVHDTLEPDIYNVIIETANKLNIKVIGHVPYKMNLEKTIDANQYSIDICHMVKNLDQTIKLAKSQIWFCPVLVTAKKSQQLFDRSNLLKDPNLKYERPDVIKYWTKFPAGKLQIKWIKDLISVFNENGGRLILGTGCLAPFVLHGFSIHEELQLLVEEGLTPYEALKSGTFNAAECLGIIDRSGTIEEGKNADLVLLENNPLDKIENTKNIIGVMVKGKWLNKNDLKIKLEKVADKYRK